METHGENQRNRKFKIVLATMGLMFTAFLLVAWSPGLKEVFATLCFFLLSAAGMFFGANVWEKLGQKKL